MPKMKAYASFDLYLADQRPKNQAVIRALRTFVRRTAPALVESVKWGNGCWLNGLAPVAYVYAGEPEYTQFGFIHGSKLDDPEKRLEGDGAYVRHIKVRRPRDIDARAFAELLLQAVERTPLKLTVGRRKAKSASKRKQTRAGAQRKQTRAAPKRKGTRARSPRKSSRAR